MHQNIKFRLIIFFVDILLNDACMLEEIIFVMGDCQNHINSSLFFMEK